MLGGSYWKHTHQNFPFSSLGVPRHSSSQVNSTAQSQGVWTPVDRAQASPELLGGAPRYVTWIILSGIAFSIDARFPLNCELPHVFSMVAAFDRFSNIG